MSFKEYLEDYDAKEEESLNRYLSRFAAGRIPTDVTYPPPGRFPGIKLPFAQPKLCSIWGVIPFHGSALLSLPCVNNVEMFDFLLEDTGVNSKNLSEAMSFSRETGRLAFGLTGHATLYRNLDFLEPLFQEFRPPRGIALPVDRIVRGVTFKGEALAFLDLAKHGFSDSLLEFMATSGGADRALFQATLNNFASEYAFLRSCGYSHLADAVESRIVSDPRGAHTLLVALESVLVEPSLNVTGGPIVLGDSVVSATEAFPGIREVRSRVRAQQLEGYEVGRFVLRKLVAYPETREGCVMVIDQYDKVGLAEVRSALYRSIREENLELLTSSAETIRQVCENAWASADRFRWVEKGGGLVPALTVGVIGALATSNPVVGALSSVGGVILDKTLGERSGDTFKRVAGTLLRSSHLVTIYDFKKCLAGSDDG